jgi:ATP adenylyltransferase
VTFDQLWAGWRSQYVSSVFDDPHEALAHDGAPMKASGKGAAEEFSGCVFCAILASHESDEARKVVHCGTNTVVLLNAFPYASGHLLILPMRHVDEIEALTPTEGIELWDMTREAIVAVKRAYRPDGLNIGANLGRPAGAGIPAHLHLHVVPRWTGDTNFMTSIASVRVLPEALSDSWKKLRGAWST